MHGGDYLGIRSFPINNEGTKAAEKQQHTQRNTFNNLFIPSCNNSERHKSLFGPGVEEERDGSDSDIWP